MAALKLVILASLVLLASAGKAAVAPDPAPSMLEDLLITPGKDVLNAGVDLAKDAVGLLMGAPRFAADVAIYVIGLLRKLPSFASKLYNADSTTFDSCTQFTVSTASTVFVLYAGLAALNLLLSMIALVKDANKKYLKLPKSLFGQDVSNPVFDAVQEYVLDPIIAWKNPVFMGELVGEPTLAAAAKSIAGAMSGCMILACTPDVLSLMAGGANKDNAEAIAWTLGTALGVKYLVNKA